MILEKVGKLNYHQEAGRLAAISQYPLVWRRERDVCSAEDDLGIDDLDI